MIHVYHGEGKGKTTAAIGLSIRAAGAGKRVVFAQFLKGSDTSELNVLKQVNEITILRNQKDLGFVFQMSEEQKKMLIEMHDETLNSVIRLIQNQEADMVVLDEITYVYNDRLINTDKLEQLIEQIPKTCELILTGRDPDAFFLNHADYITQMVCERHPYERKIPARKGIEF